MDIHITTPALISPLAGHPAGTVWPGKRDALLNHAASAGLVRLHSRLAPRVPPPPYPAITPRTAKQSLIFCERWKGEAHRLPMAEPSRGVPGQAEWNGPRTITRDADNPPCPLPAPTASDWTAGRLAA
jgi:hypothetical protein